MTSPVDDVLRKYQQRLAASTEGSFLPPSKIQSREYTLFRKEALEKKLTYYESWCQFAERVLPVKVKDKDVPALEESLRICHLEISPNSTASFAAFTAASNISPTFL